MGHSVGRLIILLSLGLLGSCARPDLFEHQALIQNPAAANLPAPKPGFVWATANQQYQRSGLHHLIWGKHHRPVWEAPVQAQILDLKQVKGGLRPAEMGGGLQSTSLTLHHASGQTFTLRTLDKNPAKSLPPFWQKTFISNLMRDQTSALNPYAAFIIPPLAEASQVFHTNPALYYVPGSNAGLGDYHQQFGGKLAMLEEKFVNEKSITPALGPAQQILNTEDLFKRLEQSPQHQVNQLAFARARLFDVLLGDLDRHEGQWNWAAYPNEQGGFWYKPIPKDRDYALYQFADGLIPWILTRRWLVGGIKVFIHNIPDVGGLIHKSQELDESLLNQVTGAEWEQIAREMQNSLTPAVITDAVALFPDSVYQITGAQTTAKLEKRVKLLPQMAGEFYEILAKEVKITGTKAPERFVVQVQNPRKLVVEVYTLPATPGASPGQIFKREFSYPETKKIVLQGLEKEDVLELPTQTRQKSKIKIIKTD